MEASFTPVFETQRNCPHNWPLSITLSGSIEAPSGCYILDINITPLNPSLTLPIQQIMLLSTSPTTALDILFSPMARQVTQDLDTHRLLLTISQISISGWILVEAYFIQFGDFGRIDGDKFVLRQDETC
ncbi:hypothetical protein HRR83_003523 [Exophiala dermatitidis]|nr:hypothetical protein HRR79_006192 [Exophiala dermatitidis]KAJ4579770.1 hypothetical protein HRR82_004903 [Exophiala dermatitidis]KAJ4580576.1 hypothetical protein HRR81_002740 [Exophiala dermatitidis]KAJ4600463.1 hypothetical protein HRR83_003523 [Exophiala dermatitidis]KAJ4611695.1 hypothetical protein HRR88_008706 [Exophiala dermatitidis]